MALGAYAHQDLPFEQLVDALVTERDRSRTPLVQVSFAYTAGELGTVAADQATGGSHEPLEGTLAERLVAKVDLSVTMGEVGGGWLTGGINYSTALFDHATAERMAGHLVTLLEAVADAPGQPVSRLPVLGAGEYHQMVRGWNGTGAPGPAGGVAELVTASAARGPDAVAVSCHGEVLTYGGLLARSGRLARYLGHLGVGPETVVGLHLAGGLGMVVTILAVLQAGGAYLPVDPGYPAERLAFMLADSQAAVLVGDRRLAGLPAAGVTHRGRQQEPGSDPPGEDRGAGGRAACSRCPAPGSAGVRFVYLGVGRPAQGRHGHPAQPGQPGRGPARRPWSAWPRHRLADGLVQL
jgi:non-ribosomal peptide synthetase component F